MPEMVNTCFFLLFSLLFLSAAIPGSSQGVETVQFEVINNVSNTKAGIRFDKEVGADYLKKQLANCTQFIWKLFNYTTLNETRGFEKVTWIIDRVPLGVAVTTDNMTTIDSHWIEIFEGDFRNELTGVMYHENGHVWQFLGGNVKREMVEGMADVVRLKSGMIQKNWIKPGEGKRWDEGYGFTARFLDYVDSLKPGFISALNKKMKDPYNDSFFVELVGKPVDQLWKEYKEKYKNSINETAA